MSDGARYRVVCNDTHDEILRLGVKLYDGECGIEVPYTLKEIVDAIMNYVMDAEIKYDISVEPPEGT